MKKAFNFSSVWIDLERYEALNEKIGSRLGIESYYYSSREGGRCWARRYISIAARSGQFQRFGVTQTSVSESLDQAKLILSMLLVVCQEIFNLTQL